MKQLLFGFIALMVCEICNALPIRQNMVDTVFLYKGDTFVGKSPVLYPPAKYDFPQKLCLKNCTNFAFALGDELYVCTFHPYIFNNKNFKLRNRFVQYDWIIGADVFGGDASCYKSVYQENMYPPDDALIINGLDTLDYEKDFCCNSSFELVYGNINEGKLHLSEPFEIGFPVSKIMYILGLENINIDNFNTITFYIPENSINIEETIFRQIIPKNKDMKTVSIKICKGLIDSISFGYSVKLFDTMYINLFKFEEK